MLYCWNLPKRLGYQTLSNSFKISDNTYPIHYSFDVCNIIFLFSQTLEVSLANMLVACPIRLLISVSRVRVSEMVVLRYMN